MNTPQFVTTALVGTARQEQTDVVTGTPIDSLAAELPAQEIERRLLLQAGIWAVYRQSGEIALHIDDVPAPAPDETLPACSQSIARLLHSMLLGEHEDLLPTALHYLREADLRLPYELLPQALSVRNATLQEAVFPVLGERGMWLGQFNPAWSWVKNFLPVVDGALPDDAETTWQEGTTGQRSEILRRLRSIDPAKARAWLEGVWKQEKAEARLELIQTLEVGLSSEDEPFLEKALDDRAASVKAVVPAMLARIPTSAFVQRMVSRADAILTNDGSNLKLKLPAAFDKMWLRDGIDEKPQTGVGERSWWMVQIIGSVPPSHWEEQFGLAPVALVAMAEADTSGVSLIEAWSRAAHLFAAQSWIEPLWDWWQKLPRKKYAPLVARMRDELLQHVPAALLESKVLPMMLNHTLSEFEDWKDLLNLLPTPWSREFGDAYLQAIRSHVATLKLDKKNYYPYMDWWFGSLEATATGLPFSCFSLALEAWPLPEESCWQYDQWRDQLQEFTRTLRIRQQLKEELMK